jgi:hypothetical protein
VNDQALACRPDWAAALAKSHTISKVCANCLVRVDTGVLGVVAMSIDINLAWNGTWRPFRHLSEVQPKLEIRMDTADRFLRFAAECQAMAKLSPSRENKLLWTDLAQRWQRCAQLTEKLDNDLQSSGVKRRQSRSQARSASY